MSRTDTNSNSNSHGHGHTVTDGVIPIEYIDTPDPFIFTIDMADFKKISDNDKYMAGIASELNKITHPRVVLDIIDTSLTNSQTNQEHNQDIFSGGPADLVAWAASSVNSWSNDSGNANGVIKKYTYVPLSLGRNSLHFHSANSGHGKIDYSDDVKLCRQLLVKLHGNRSCFSICK